MERLLTDLHKWLLFAILFINRSIFEDHSSVESAPLNFLTVGKSFYTSPLN